MNSDIKFRGSAVQQVGTAIRDILENYSLPGGLIRNCLTCAFFRRDMELCGRHLDWGRPPARIIAYGCNEYLDEEEIPF